jgi:hypothetical protein
MVFFMQCMMAIGVDTVSIAPQDVRREESKQNVA